MVSPAALRIAGNPQGRAHLSASAPDGVMDPPDTASGGRIACLLEVEDMAGSGIVSLPPSAPSAYATPKNPLRSGASTPVFSQCHSADQRVHGRQQICALR